MKQSFDTKQIMIWYKKLTHPQASNDLIAFLQDLPNKIGTAILAIGGIAWGVALAIVMYASVQSQQIASLKSEIANTRGLTPPVPKVTKVKVEKEELEKFIEKAKSQYSDMGVTFSLQNDKIQIKGDSGRRYGVFREAVGHLQNGGSGWQVSVESLCVGRECKNIQGGGNAFLYGSFGISRVRVEMPKL